MWPALSAHTTAAGGRQTFRITWPVTHDPFDLAFVATVTSPDHQVVATGSDRVSVAATGAATGDLRIVDGGGLLYDRLSIDSAGSGMPKALHSCSTILVISVASWNGSAGSSAAV